MVYNIPVYKVEKLTKLVNKYINKAGSSIVFNISEESVLVDSNTKGIKIECKQVEFEGNYKINGWRFVATIEHSDAGNIVRCADSELESKIPQRYYTCDAECEHCHTSRVRKDTYLIYNEEKDEFKQVGKNCLFEYTQGLDASCCEALIEILDEIEDEADLDNIEFAKELGLGKYNFYIDSDDVKYLAYYFVNKEGYIKTSEGKDSTHNKIIEAISFPSKVDIVKPSKKCIDDITEYAKSLVGTEDYYGNYMHNAICAWLKSNVEIRDISLIASFISVYKKNKIMAERSANTEFVGKLGDRITFNFKDCTLAYIKYSSRYMVDDTKVWIITDDSGNVYKWATNNLEPTIEKSYDNFDITISPIRITATVKEHSEYKGVKQTVITRGKVEYDYCVKLSDGTVKHMTEEEYAKFYQENSKNSAFESFEEYFKYLDEE